MKQNNKALLTIAILQSPMIYVMILLVHITVGYLVKDQTTYEYKLPI